MVQITSAMPIAQMIGSNRIVLGNGIVHVTGAANLTGEEEKELRRKLITKALELLESNQQQSKASE